jgi:hypothetical protein
LSFPSVLDLSKVGEYPATAKAGGGFVWDAVLEYRVWCHPARGAPDETDDTDYYYAFESYEDAERFTRENDRTEEPLALVLQREYIDEHEPGKYVHVREERVAEWPVAFLSRPKRDAHTIPEFLADGAPENRLEILRGLAPRVSRGI